MTWEELKEYLKDKVFLIGLTFMDENQRILAEYQTSGTVLDLTENALISFKRKDNSLFYLPTISALFRKQNRANTGRKQREKLLSIPIT